MIAKNPNILIVGGGFVGLTLAAKLLKNESTRIVILEQSQTKIYDFKNQNYRIYEPGLDEIFNNCVKQGRLKFEQNLENDLFDIIFIC